MKMLRKSILVTLILVSLLLIPGVRADTSTTFTTTAHFDSGVKSPTTNGSLGVETTTDNPAVANGTFELGNARGDSFTTSDVDGITEKWEACGDAGFSASSRLISAGVLSLTATRSFATTQAFGFISKFSFTGDFDVRMKMAVLNTGANRLYEFGATTGSGSTGCTAGLGLTNGITWRWQSTPAIQAFNIVVGSRLTVGSAVDPGSATFYVRLARVGTATSWYYGSNGVDWTLHATDTFSFTPIKVWANLIIDQNLFDAAVNYDDFNSVGLTFSGTAYRTAGQWTSAPQSVTSERFRFLNVTYTGASALTFITAVSILNGADSTVYIDNTDRISGTSASYNVGDLAVSGSWKVRVNLTGGGSETVNVGSVTVFSFVPVPPCTAGPLGEFLDVLFPILIAFAIIMGTLAFTGLLDHRSRHFSIGTAMAIGFGILGGIVIVLTVTALLPQAAICG